MPVVLGIASLAVSAYSAYEQNRQYEETKKETEKAKQEQKDAIAKEKADAEAATQAEKDRLRREEIMRFGFSKTINTSPTGVNDNPMTQKKTLLGA
jgi:hypothetical protein